MPYIKQEQRKHIDDIINELIENILDLEVDWSAENPVDLADLRNLDGVLNYTITRLLGGVLRLDKPRYTKYNTALGVLEGIKLEMYRKQVAPYENVKEAENGPVK